ncbi:5'/3'-nucleotidase SurE [Haloarculaceae archaeon H-GB2-1]|nr:5'/3'-nucleotidase SurE [Haloarculaceae archaeon H-GB1-1]MEA5387393.1 5'/3'-nucleotidase SurE [Haloarculaceae archaeon H-GB11]MEA5408867.1 5'/3'-nucleotidase SurE [Haloarculaceae archaeon H-GB2-1]
MDESPDILLTNDDGIESTGFRALYDALSSVGNVTAVAPADDQSAVGRAMSHDVDVTDHELGYSIEGTPSDCVVAGLEALVPDADLVVSGINRGANLGEYVLGRSGTISAAVEAAFFDVPAIAVSLYVPVPEDTTWRDLDVTNGDYREAANAATYLTEHAVDAGVFDHADYLNVNAPMPGDDPAPMEITRPSHAYMMDAERDGETVVLHDRIWELMAEGDVPDPEGTDRRAVVEGRVSVSPLTAPHTTEHHEALDALAETYR